MTMEREGMSYNSGRGGGSMGQGPLVENFSFREELLKL